MTPMEIKQTRKDLGLSQTKFAERLGISYATVNRWERGRTKPKGIFLKALHYTVK